MVNLSKWPPGNMLGGVFGLLGIVLNLVALLVTEKACEVGLLGSEALLVLAIEGNLGVPGPSFFLCHSGFDSLVGGMFGSAVLVWRVSTDYVVQMLSCRFHNRTIQSYMIQSRPHDQCHLAV